MKLIRRIRRILRWLPILWRDEDFDYAYLFRIMATKLRFMAEHFEECRNHVDWEATADSAKRAALVCERIAEWGGDPAGSLDTEYGWEWKMAGWKMNRAKNRINTPPAMQEFLRLFRRHALTWWD